MTTMRRRVDHRPPAHVDGRLSQAARCREPAARCRSAAGRSPRLQADRSLHGFDEVGQRRNAHRVSRTGSPPRRRHAGRLSGWPARVLFALVSRHARRADPAAGDRTAGGPPDRPGENHCHRPHRTGRRRAFEPRSPTSAPAAASSPFVPPNMLPQARITAIDISPAALAVARQNAADHGVADRIEFVESDLFAAVDPPTAISTSSPAIRRMSPKANLINCRPACGISNRDGAGRRPARHGSDRAVDAASRRAIGAGRLAVDGNQPDDRTRRARDHRPTRRLRIGPHDQRPRRPSRASSKRNESAT